MRYLESLYYDLMREKNLNASLINFWSNHFVTESNSLGKIPQIFQQLLMRQKYCIGNFKEFVHAVGIDIMMLHYLNGFENKVGKPNENYARELYELFTLGVDNGYTQEDTVETARALTGYNVLDIAWGDITFDESTFDNGEKTIFGETGDWGYTHVIDILFEQRGELIANYICTKFYTYFVSADVNEEIVTELAQVFLDNDFDIAPVLSVLFKSKHFFDDKSFGTIIKSPKSQEVLFYLKYLKHLMLEYIVHLM